MTRTETAILRRVAPEIARLAGPNCALVEFGSGSSVKSRLLLDAMPGLAVYAPIDISRVHLDATAARLRSDYPGLAIAPVCADYMALPSLSRAKLRTPNSANARLIALRDLTGCMKWSSAPGMVAASSISGIEGDVELADAGAVERAEQEYGAVRLVGVGDVTGKVLEKPPGGLGCSMRAQTNDGSIRLPCADQSARSGEPFHLMGPPPSGLNHWLPNQQKPPCDMQKTRIGCGGGGVKEFFRCMGKKRWTG